MFLQCKLILIRTLSIHQTVVYSNKEKNTVKNKLKWILRKRRLENSEPKQFEMIDNTTHTVNRRHAIYVQYSNTYIGTSKD